MGGCCSSEEPGVIHHQPNHQPPGYPPVNPMYPPNPEPPINQMYPPPQHEPPVNQMYPPHNEPPVNQMYPPHHEPPVNPMYPPHPEPPTSHMYPPNRDPPFNPTYPNEESLQQSLYPQLNPLPESNPHPSYPPLGLNPHDSSDDAGYKWVHMSAGMPVPDTAVVGGMDIDGATIYVGRALHDGDMLPAKVIPEKHIAYVCHAGREISKHTFEVLVKSDFTWEYASNGHVPANAVIAGQTSDGEPLYVGRASHEGSQTIGKVQQSHGCLYIPFDGQEISHRDYEVLVMH